MVKPSSFPTVPLTIGFGQTKVTLCPLETIYLAIEFVETETPVIYGK